MQPLDFEFLKNRYDYELIRKEQLTSSLSLPVGVLGGLASLLALMARSCSYQSRLLSILFLVPLTAAVVAFVACLWQLANAYHRQEYLYLPLLRDIETNKEELLSFADAMAGDEAEVLEEFESRFRRRILAAADRNTENNDRRSSWLFWARVWLFALLAFVALAGIPYIVDQVRFHAQTRTTSATAGAGDTVAEHDAETPGLPAESSHPRR